MICAGAANLRVPSRSDDRQGTTTASLSWKVASGIRGFLLLARSTLYIGSGSLRPVRFTIRLSGGWGLLTCSLRARIHQNDPGRSTRIQGTDSGGETVRKPTLCPDRPFSPSWKPEAAVAFRPASRSATSATRPASAGKPGAAAGSSEAEEHEE